MKVIEGKAVKQWVCNFSGCSKKITKGQEYFLWHKNGDALRQHQDHGAPAQPTVKAAAEKPKATKNNTKKATKKATKGGKKQ